SFVVLTVPLIAWKGLDRNRVNWNWLIAAAFLAASVIASGSRAGAALIAAECLLFPLLVRNKSPVTSGKLRIAGLTTILLIGAFVAVTGSTMLAYKLQDRDPLRYRREMIGSAVEMARARPLTGFGLGTFPKVYPAFATFDSGHIVNHAHNDWAEWAA